MASSENGGKKCHQVSPPIHPVLDTEETVLVGGLVERGNKQEEKMPTVTPVCQPPATALTPQVCLSPSPVLFSVLMPLVRSCRQTKAARALELMARLRLAATRSRSAAAGDEVYCLTSPTRLVRCLSSVGPPG
ncbi:hypothetical protein H0G86_000606 [Trichoderma simmonsii]|uniref:Uncharacterized protein n=1 Tax=Trichoderma simmonsii TaxID=1491479 RepID=A0A8G0L307_9HYPO|nr:hypothetical protein H0G86_000606 [Trichoderma simmonsii]